MTRPTQAEILLPALRTNLSLLKEKFGSPPVRLIAVIKADAYGHGAVRIAHLLAQEGVKDFAVACLEEALELALDGLQQKIYILGPLLADEVEEIFLRGFIPLISSPDDLQLLQSLFFSSPGLRTPVKPFPIILKLDTGMGRIGLLPEQLSSICDQLRQFPQLRPFGLFSHLACAESPDPSDQAYTQRQIEDFTLLVEGLKRVWPSLEILSLANSAGALFFPAARMTAVRTGIMLYGVRPAAGMTEPPGLRPVMRLVTTISQVRSLPAGTSISYGRKTRLTTPSRIAVLPVGYADGLQRRLPPGFSFFVRGKAAPLTGVITMDLTMIDVTNVPAVKPGDRVLLLGEDVQKEEVEQKSSAAVKVSVPAETHAQAAGMIPYEILTAVGKRVRRVYLEEG